jgi:AcrR family transcriptional regulator
VAPNSPKSKIDSNSESTLDIAALRRTPLRARGQATFDAILDVTAQLIEDKGHEALTTNIIASAAGINIASLYQYFSNKQAILVALFDRQTQARSDLLAHNFQRLLNEKDWQTVVRESIDVIADIRAKQTGSTGLRLALKSSPELEAHERAANDGPASVFAQLLQGQAKLSPEKAMLVARCGMEIGTVLLDNWSLRSDPADRRLVDEAKIAVIAYLGTYLDRPKPMA